VYPSLYPAPYTELIRPKLSRTSHKPFSHALQKLSSVVVAGCRRCEMDSPLWRLVALGAALSG